jgi:Peptidase family M48
MRPSLAKRWKKFTTKMRRNSLFQTACTPEARNNTFTAAWGGIDLLIAWHCDTNNCMILLVFFLQLLQDSTQMQVVEDYNRHICLKLGTVGDIRLTADSTVLAGNSPDGHVFISTGLFARAQNEAQLAGVIAHETAHAAAGTRCIRFMHIDTIDTNDTEIQDDRKHEASADETAIKMLTKAGYEPMAMLDFFSKYRREGINLPNAYSARDLLMERLEIEATDHPLKDAVINTPEFDRVHGLIK